MEHGKNCIQLYRDANHSPLGVDSTHSTSNLRPSVSAPQADAKNQEAALSLAIRFENDKGTTEYPTNCQKLGNGDGVERALNSDARLSPNAGYDQRSVRY